ncbi:MAG: TldD/PmbA family protein [Leptospiraceae bacterium]|nr:TldD/PmbA family protein [Leptospiraceae bacterium]MDW8307397.1 TldD/PmbA family protein [Leptospiraceae bacterium]
MNLNILTDVIEAAQGEGAEFSEIYLEECRQDQFIFQDRKLEEASSGIDFGIGIRLFYGSQVLYTYTNKWEKDHLVKIVRKLMDSLPGEKTKKTFVLPELVENLPRKKGALWPNPLILDFLRRSDEKARGLSPRIAQVTSTFRCVQKDITIINSEGLFRQERRNYVRFLVSVTAEENSERFMATEAPGFMNPGELERLIHPETLAQKAAERALLMLRAGYIPGGTMPVILGNGFGGVIFHEACGHPLETEAVRRKASPFADKIGEKIAHEKVTAIDEGFREGDYGSIVYDDEGTPVEKTILIEKGVLKNFLSDRVGSRETGHRLTGSARRESYRYPPVARMRNTYIAPGDDSLEDMIASVDFGLYAKKMGGGSVNSATGEFNFAVEEGYVIRKGKIAEPVRGATLIGKGEEILPRISMVGQDLELAAGTCGATSGLIPVTVGQPTIKVDAILVGGR